MTASRCYVEMEQNMFIVVGLGNPTKKYEKTRHNVGFDCIDYLADKYGISVSENKCKALVGSGIMEGQKVLLVKPQTFMNASGEAVCAIMNYFKIDPETEMLVIYDDITLAPGGLRIRKKGSAGGHNGIKSLIALCGTQGFARVRIGVGEKPEGWDLADHVLGHFSKEDRMLVDDAIKDAADAAALIIRGQIEEAMNIYNGKGKE